MVEPNRALVSLALHQYQSGIVNRCGEVFPRSQTPTKHAGRNSTINAVVNFFIVHSTHIVSSSLEQTSRQCWHASWSIINQSKAGDLWNHSTIDAEQVSRHLCVSLARHALQHNAVPRACEVALYLFAVCFYSSLDIERLSEPRPKHRVCIYCAFDLKMMWRHLIFFDSEKPFEESPQHVTFDWNSCNRRKHAKLCECVYFILPSKFTQYYNQASSRRDSSNKTVTRAKWKRLTKNKHINTIIHSPTTTTTKKKEMEKSPK